METVNIIFRDAWVELLSKVEITRIDLSVWDFDQGKETRYQIAYYADLLHGLLYNIPFYLHLDSMIYSVNLNRSDAANFFVQIAKFVTSFRINILRRYNEPGEYITMIKQILTAKCERLNIPEQCPFSLCDIENMCQVS